MGIKAAVRPVVRLTVNGEVLEVRAYTYTAPVDALGASLAIELAESGLQIASDAVVTFERGLRKGATSSLVKLVDQGNLAGKQARIEFSGDRLRLNAVNTLADRWRLGPRMPIVLYDPAWIEFADLHVYSQFADIIDYDGEYIIPETIARRRLTFYDVLRYAYVDGCKFTKVITNIEDYPVHRADFPLGTGYHAAAKKYYGMVKVAIFADDSDTLYILDIDATLPAGMITAVRQISGANVTALAIDEPLDPRINAILLTYKVDLRNTGSEWPETATDDVKVSETPDTGKPFTHGWYKQYFEVHVKQFHDNPDNPTAITREVLWKTVTSTYAGDERTGLPLMTSRETIEYVYRQGWRLLVGFNKTLEARLPLPYGEGKRLVLQAAETETSKTTWAASLYNPDEWIKLQEITDREGMILTEGVYLLAGDGYQLASQVTSATPLMQASLNRQVAQDGFQNVIRGDIATTITNFIDTGSNLVAGLTTKIDHLIPQTESARVSQNIATRKSNVAYLRSQTMLITASDVDPTDTSEATYGEIVPATKDAGELPVERAIKLAVRELKRIKQPPRNVEIEYPYFDAALRRGSLRKIVARNHPGESMYLVTGLREQGENLHGEGAKIHQTASAIKVVNL